MYFIFAHPLLHTHFLLFFEYFRSELKDENLVNDQPLMKSSDGNSENNFDDSENSVNHKPVIKRQKSREHHSSSGSSNKSHISSRTSSKNHSR